MLENDRHGLYYIPGRIRVKNGANSEELLLIDSGASDNFVSRSWVTKHHIITTKLSQQLALKFANGSSSYHPMERVELTVMTGDQEALTSFLVTQLERVNFILGVPWLKDANPIIDWQEGALSLKTGEKISLIKPASKINVILMARPAPIVRDANRIHSVVPDDSIDALLKSCSELFNEPKSLPPRRTKFDHSISLMKGSRPPPARMIRLSQSEQLELETQLKVLVGKGFIRRSTSQYGAPVFFVPKKNGDQRLVVDWRGLNEITIKDRTPLPRISDLLSLLGRARFFSKLDAYSGYNQLRIKEGDEYKTAMLTPFGLFEWLVMGFGLTNGPASFQSFMNEILGDLLRQGVIVYLDDILIYSQSLEEHRILLGKVLDKLKLFKVYLNPEKCTFASSTIEFLGHLVSNGNVSIALDKTSAVSSLQPPKTKQQVRHVLGVFGFLRDHIRDFALLAKPLNKLTKKKTSWSKLPEQARISFHKLKAAVLDAPSLRIPDPAGPLILACDASDTGGAAVLWQLLAGKRYPVGFFSRQFNERECKWITRDKECHAVLEAIEHFQFFLKGRKFVVETDCAALQHLRTQRTPAGLSQRLDRVLDELARYDFEIVHVKGVLNGVADGLSRLLPSEEARKDKQIPQTETILNVTSLILPTDLTELTQAWMKDQKSKHVLQRLLMNRENGIKDKSSHWTLGPNSEILLNGKVFVPANASGFKRKILYQAHDSMLAQHQGVAATLRIIEKKFVWQNIAKHVTEYIKNCERCQRSTKSNKTHGLLKPLSIPSERWKDISMDFMTGLPKKSEASNDSLLVIVDRLTKRVHLIPTQSTATAEVIAHIFIHQYFKLHGLPDSIVSDRDPKFTSEFWREVSKFLGITQRLSTTAHPQSDGQTERMNRTINERIRKCLTNHDEWENFLPLLEFSINSSYSNSIGMTPFEADLGFEPRGLPDFSTHYSPSITLPFLQKMRSNLQVIRTNIGVAQEGQRIQADKSRVELSLKVGDEVLISSDIINQPSKRQTKEKWNDKFYGPFTVTKLVDTNAVRVKLPKGLRMHDVINISYLKKFKRPQSDDDFHNKEVASNSDLPVLKRILNHRKPKGAHSRLEFLVLMETPGNKKRLPDWRDAQDLWKDNQEGRQVIDKYLKANDLSLELS